MRKGLVDMCTGTRPPSTRYTCDSLCSSVREGGALTPPLLIEGLAAAAAAAGTAAAAAATAWPTFIILISRLPWEQLQGFRQCPSLSEDGA